MPAFSVYLEGTRSHNEGRVSTPACYLLLYSAEGLHFSALLVICRTESFQENRLFHFQAHVASSEAAGIANTAPRGQNKPSTVTTISGNWLS